MPAPDPTSASPTTAAPDAAAQAAPAARPARPPVDASMRLLREVMDHPLDPAYVRAARARRQGARPGAVLGLVTVLIAVVCGFVATRGVVELRRPEPEQAAGRAALEREIERRTSAADAAQQRIQLLRTEIAAAQQAQLNAQGDAALAAKVQQLGLLTGELPVSGPGLEFSIADARPPDGEAVVDPRAESGADDGRVLDRDLQVVVNGLWASEAEAIAINGRRLTSLSAIRSAGQAILVDFRPLVPPYKIQAIGDPTALQTGFSSTRAAQYLQSLRDNFGVQVSITSATDLRLPAAGAFQLRAAGVGPSGPPSPRSSGAPSGTSSGSVPGGTPSPASVSPRSTGTSGNDGVPSPTEVTP